MRLSPYSITLVLSDVLNGVIPSAAASLYYFQNHACLNTFYTYVTSSFFSFYNNSDSGILASVLFAAISLSDSPVGFEKGKHVFYRFHWNLHRCRNAWLCSNLITKSDLVFFCSDSVKLRQSYPNTINNCYVELEQRLILLRVYLVL